MPRPGRNRRFALLTDETSVVDVSPEGTLTRPDGSKSSFSSPSSRFSSVTSGKSTNKLQSLFNPFTKTQDRMDQLTELLTSYSTHGLPPLPDWITRGRPHYNPHSLYLEEHWTDIVEGHEKMNKRQRDQQEALWELLSTEVEYIKKLKVVIDLFYSCLVTLQSSQLLNEVETENVFSNICDVFYATCHFWDVHMSQVLKRSRETKEPLDPCLLKSGFQVFDKLFEPYIKYCLDQEHCRDYLKCKIKENEIFRTFISWAEGQTQCNRLSLVDLIVKPFQRLTKYALLLFAIKKPLEKMETNGNVDQQRRDISKMVEQVERFVLQVNRAMRQRHEHVQLSLMMERIDAYEAVEVPSDECLKMTEQFCKLDLSMPVPGCSHNEMRNLLFEGTLKLKDTYTKTDVYCFLLTDMILITKPTGKRGDKVKVIKPPMRLDKIIVQSMRDVASFMLMYLNEYSMAQAVYTFHGDSKLWLAHVTKAQRDYQAKKLSNSFLRPEHHDTERSGSCDTELSTRREGGIKSTTSFVDDYRVGKSSVDPSMHSYRSQLSVPSIYTDDRHQSGLLSPSMSSIEERKVFSEKIKRKVVHGFPSGEKLTELMDENMGEKNYEGGHLSSSTYNLSSTEENSSDRPTTLSTRPAVTHHRRHSSDPIRDLESFNATLLSSSYPGSPDDDESTKKIGWSLGDAASSEIHPGTDFESPDSEKTSDGSTTNLDSGGSKTSLVQLTTMEIIREFLPPDTSNSEPDFIQRFGNETERVSDEPPPNYIRRKIIIPLLEIQQPSTGNPSPDSKADVEFNTMLKETNETVLTTTKGLKQLPPAGTKATGVLHKDAPEHVPSCVHSVDQEIKILNETPARNNANPINKDIEPEKTIIDSDNSIDKSKSLDEHIDSSSKALHICEDNDSFELSDRKEGTKDNGSQTSDSNRSPEEEFHLCYLPEEYFCFSSPPHSPTIHSCESSPWKDGKGRPRTVIVVEASTQTPLEFLIAGYYAASSIDRSPCSRSYRSVWSSKSLPDIFDVLPSTGLSVPAYFASKLICNEKLSTPHDYF